MPLQHRVISVRAESAARRRFESLRVAPSKVEGRKAQGKRVDAADLAGAEAGADSIQRA